jgi:hypothetical protein
VKVNELIKSGGVESPTENFVPLVTNRDRYPDAPRYLPNYILINKKKILALKKKLNVVKFKDHSEPITALFLCEPWRAAEEFDNYEVEPRMIEMAMLRMKQILPFSCNKYPDLA